MAFSFPLPVTATKPSDSPATKNPFSFTFCSENLPPLPDTPSASKKQDEDLASTFNCSICLDFFKIPKNLPNCGHCYCLHCLQLLVQRELNKQKITCPDCRTQSPLGIGGVADLKTNVHLQRGAEMVKKYSENFLANMLANVSRSSSTDRCPHQLYLTTSNSFACDHCNSKFCDRCVIVHSEVMKTEILQRGNNLPERINKAVEEVDGKVERLKSAVDNDLLQIESKIKEACRTLEVAVSEAVTMERDKLLEQARSFGQRQLQKVQQTVSSVRQKQSLDVTLVSEVALLAKSSVLSCSLGEVAKLHKKVSERDAEVKALEKLKEPGASSIGKVIFKPDDRLLKSVIGQFKAFSIGSVEENTAKSV